MKTPKLQKTSKKRQNSEFDELDFNFSESIFDECVTHISTKEVYQGINPVLITQLKTGSHQKKNKFFVGHTTTEFEESTRRENSKEKKIQSKSNFCNDENDISIEIFSRKNKISKKGNFQRENEKIKNDYKNNFLGDEENPTNLINESEIDNWLSDSSDGEEFESDKKKDLMKRFSLTTPEKFNYPLEDPECQKNVVQNFHDSLDFAFIEGDEKEESSNFPKKSLKKFELLSSTSQRKYAKSTKTINSEKLFSSSSNTAKKFTSIESLNETKNDSQRRRRISCFATPLPPRSKFSKNLKKIGSLSPKKSPQKNRKSSKSKKYFLKNSKKNAIRPLKSILKSSHLEVEFQRVRRGSRNSGFEEKSEKNVSFNKKKYVYIYSSHRKIESRRKKKRKVTKHVRKKNLTGEEF